MFPSEGEPKQATKKRRLPLPNKKMLLIGGGVFVLSLVAVAAFIIFNRPAVVVPKEIKQKAKSSIYVPAKLPGNYKVSEDSFGMVEDDTVLVFEADDGVGAKLIFSEQPRPKSFDFENFYKGQFQDAKTLSGVPYPSVWGKATDGRLALSMVTNDTWVLMATSAPLNDSDMLRIAQALQRN